jgi:serine acetyltransferase
MVGMGSVVTHDVPPHALVVGNPARLAGLVCACGEVVARATAHAVPHGEHPCHCGRRVPWPQPN